MMYNDTMRKERKIIFTPQELLSFTKKVLDRICNDCCPSCQVILNWHDYYSDDDIKGITQEILGENEKANNIS